jgi:F-type H+-transporting ATPase subunit a
MHISIVAEKIFNLFGLPVTNTLLTTWIGMAIVIILVLVVSRKPKLIPMGLYQIFELLVEFLYNLVDGVMNDAKLTRKYFPLIATIFIFVLAGNLFDIMPGVGTIGFREIEHGKQIFVPFFRAPTTDLNATLALAIVSVVSIQIAGILALGFLKYGKKYFNFSGPLQFCIGILELILEFAKLVAFSFRLFGNIFAGEVLLTVMSFLVPYLVPVPFYGLELFVAFIQAFVFALLTTVFVKMATIDTHK